MNLRSSSSVVNFRQIFVSYAPVELKILAIHSFPHFSHRYLDIFGWNFVYDFVVMNYRSSLNVVTFRQFFERVMLFFELRILEVHSFLHFSHTCFGILSCNFVSYIMMPICFSNVAGSAKRHRWFSIYITVVSFVHMEIFSTHILNTIMKDTI